MDSSCPQIGLSPDEICELASADLAGGDVLVFYTMESLKQRIGLAKNLAWSAFPR